MESEDPGLAEGAADAADQPDTAKGKKSGKRKKSDEDELEAWRIADLVDRVERVHYSRLMLDTNQEHGQVVFPLQCCFHGGTVTGQGGWLGVMAV